MKHPVIAVAGSLASLALAAAVIADTSTATEAVRQACAGQFEKLCPGVEEGGGALRACARAHFFKFTASCRKAMMHMPKATQGNAPAGGSAPKP